LKACFCGFRTRHYESFSQRPSSPEQIEAALEQFGRVKDRGIRLHRQGQKVQLVSAPEATLYIERFLGLSTSAKLSTPALETLTIIAYRRPLPGPKSRPSGRKQRRRLRP
jgi:chromosome segregation and condensation protein ScpB